MNNLTFLIYYSLILIFLLLFQHLNKELYYIFNFLIYTYAITNLYLKICLLDSF